MGEAPYRVDRMLTTLRSAGWLRSIVGVALGSFTGCEPREDERTVEAVLAERLGGLGVPVVSGLALGHRASDREIVLGAAAEIDGTGGFLAPLEGLHAPLGQSGSSELDLAGMHTKKA